jgi:hypothetical protein
MSLMEKFAQSEANEQVSSSIDRGLDRVGPNVKYLVYWHLQKIGHIKRSDITSNPENFVSALRVLYRESSAAVERAIVQELNISFGLDCSPNQLVGAINAARKKAEQIKVI